MDSNKKRRLQYISFWIAIAALWGNQLIHLQYDYQEHQQLHSQEQQIQKTSQALMAATVCQACLVELSGLATKKDVQPVLHIL